MDSSPDGTPLQFDTAHSTAATSLVDGTQVTCSACHRALSESDFDVNGQPVCESCCRQLEQHAETPRQWRTFARATLLGFIGAVIGAILYYAVIAITNFEIGIVAIAIGYMVGYGIRMGYEGSRRTTLPGGCAGADLLGCRARGHAACLSADPLPPSRTPPKKLLRTLTAGAALSMSLSHPLHPWHLIHLIHLMHRTSPSQSKSAARFSGPAWLCLLPYPC